MVLNVTEPYTNSAAARLNDIITKSDRLPWTIEPTPVAELEQAAKGELSEEQDAAIRQRMETEAPAAQSISGQEQDVEGMVEDTRQQAVDEAKMMRLEAKKKAEKAMRRIQDWHEESHFLSHVRKCILDATKLGTLVLKGPYPTKTKKAVFINGKMEIHEAIKPRSARIDPWNFFPDPACGDDVHNGEYVFERDWTSKSAARKLVMQPQYFKEQIKKALTKETGAMGSQRGIDDKAQHVNSAEPNESSNRYALWYCYIWMGAEDLKELGADVDLSEESDAVLAEMPVIITLLNDTIIGISRNPLSDGAFPYDVFAWNELEGIPWGEGIPRKIASPQRICNAATRAMMDNAGRASGPMLVYDDASVEPETENETFVSPWKVWRRVNQYGAMAEKPGNVTDSITLLNTPMIADQLQNIVYFAMDFAEKVTGMPWLLMGQQSGGSQQEGSAVGVTRIMNENASAALRSIGARLDDQLIEPHVRRYYQWLLEHSDADDEKGDLEVVATGSTSLIENELKANQLQTIAQYVAQPQFGIDPKKFMSHLMKSLDIEAEDLGYDDMEWQEIVASMSQPPQDPALEIEAMRQETQLTKIQAESLSKDKEIQMNLIIEEWRREGAMNIAKLKADIQQMEVQLKQTNMEASERQHLEGLKERLAESVIKMESDERKVVAQLEAAKAKGQTNTEG